MDEREKPGSEEDILDSLLKRIQGGTADRLESQMREAGELKQKESTASQGRLEQMWLQEHERQQTLAQARAEQRRQEQRLVRYAIVGAVLLILIVLLLAILLSRMDGGTTPESLPWLLNAYV